MNSEIDMNSINSINGIYRNRNSNRNFNHETNSNEMNIITYEQYKNNIEYLKDIIRDGNIMKIEEYKLYENISSIIHCKNISDNYEICYNEFLTFLEIYDTQYKDKYENLLHYILENISCQEKKLLPVDENGNTIFLLKPVLRRESNRNYMYIIPNDNIYNYILSIRVNVTQIFQYETQFQHIITNNCSQTIETM